MDEELAAVLAESRDLLNASSQLEADMAYRAELERQGLLPDVRLPEPKTRTWPETTLLYRTHHPPPQQEQDWSGWEAWLDERLNKALNEFASIIGEETARATAQQIKAENASLRKEVEELRSEVTLLRAVSKGTVMPMRGRNVA